MKESILNARTHRRYRSEKVDSETLKEILQIAKNTPSALNMQLSRYIIINEDQELIDKIFHLTNLPTVHLVEEEYKPSGFIVVVAEKEKIKSRDYLLFDQGIAYQTLNLLMGDYGLRTVCMFSPSKKKIAACLDLDTDKYEVCYTIGYGYPIAQKRNIVETTDPTFWKYYKDEDGNYTVPKLTLDTVLLEIK